MEDESAPGELELVRAFVNTFDINEGIEALDSPDRLRGWLIDNQLAGSVVSVGNAELDRAVALREALRSMLLANNTGELVSEAVAVVNAEADRTRPRLWFDDHESGAIGTGQPHDLDGALGRILGIVFTSMTLGTWARLKVCQNDECRWAVYDHSKNHSKRWCSMSECGGRSKAREYWRRQKGLDPA